ncbi:hypothetical protein DPMN_029983 [Dreissena polymorpha]|uniref:Uncharacterized protein n=1 Tax=Dreissena polymorpha TaxID=45954 RepID=A0A9D4LZ46_DREPO|nr:hypothetical protein DPMN_029983 [Dreissena polymorpha]
MLAQEGIADIHTNVGPISSRVALPISGRCNYRSRADIHTDVGPTLRRVALPVSGRCNYRCRADIEINIGPILNVCWAGTNTNRSLLKHAAGLLIAQLVREIGLSLVDFEP